MVAFKNPSKIGNNNVTEDPFGNISASSGSKADDFVFRFSTKYFDGETGLSYYGFRMYSPEMGRWISRDPIGEKGGANIYGFVNNNAITHLDILGLCIKACCSSELAARDAGRKAYSSQSV